MSDGTGPYLRFEITVAAAIVTSDDRILNGDMLDGTMAFGRLIADGPAIDAGKVTSERSVAVLAREVANLSTAIRVFVGQHFAFLGAIEDGRGLIDGGREVGKTTVTGKALIGYVPEPAEGAPVQ